VTEKTAGTRPADGQAADTFVTVITSFESFDPRKGSARAWVFGIARHVYAAHCEAYSQQQHRLRRLAGRRELDQDQVEELHFSMGQTGGSKGSSSGSRYVTTHAGASGSGPVRVSGSSGSAEPGARPPRRG
jgi:hypothetical protein